MNGGAARVDGQVACRHRYPEMRDRKTTTLGGTVLREPFPAQLIILVRNADILPENAKVAKCRPNPGMAPATTFPVE